MRLIPARSYLVPRVTARMLANSVSFSNKTMVAAICAIFHARYSYFSAVCNSLEQTVEYSNVCDFRSATVTLSWIFKVFRTGYESSYARKLCHGVTLAKQNDGGGDLLLVCLMRWNNPWFTHM